MGVRRGVLEMSRVKEILRLRELGLGQCEIARAANVARSSVQDYVRRAAALGVRYAEIRDLSESEVFERLGKSFPGRREKQDLSVEFERVSAELTRRGVTLALLWSELRGSGNVAVSYQTFCRAYAKWARKAHATLRIHHPPGRAVFVDYAGMKMRVADRETGELREVPIFVAALGASYLKYVEATADATLRSWIGSHVRTFEFFGGVTECVVPDNTKTGVKSACLYDPELNRTYQELAEHYQVAAIPTRSAKPRDKAKVERAVLDVERWVLAPLRDRTFYSLDDLNAALRELTEALNRRKMKDRGVSAQELFEQYEKATLRPLPSFPFEYAEWKTAKVARDYHVQVEKHLYSVPYWLIGEEVQVRISERRVRVLHNNTVVAEHLRSAKTYGSTTLEAHMPASHIAVASQSLDSLRRWAQEVGPETARHVETMMLERRRPEFALRPILGIKRLAEKLGSSKIERACATANENKICGYGVIKRLLAQMSAEPAADTAPLMHSNLRGPGYFH